MTKMDKVEMMLAAAGFKVSGDFRITRGPKRLCDILECWNVGAWHEGKHVEIYSGHTMTELAKTGLIVERNHRNTCLYGDYVAVPIPKRK